MNFPTKGAYSNSLNKPSSSLYQNPLLIKPFKSLPKEIGICGAGTIGPDIGYYLKSALPSIKLYLLDIAEKPLKDAERRLSGYAKKAVDKKKMSAKKAAAVLENIYYTTNYEDLKNCDFVIEAATESIPLKQKIFAQIESLVKKDTIITSNTSSIPADRIFSEMKYQLNLLLMNHIQKCFAKHCSKR